MYWVFVGVMAVLCFTGRLGALTGIQIAEVLVISVCMASMALIRHWTNVKRLVAGTENKTYLLKKNRQ
jgi:glycerol-3-phosphate acyltransferase PlsY